ncbi:ATP-dependent zinc protease [Pseudomonas neustonica]|uniref:ATP-dependent zinc protease n=1 Tax=Pseudomonas neustonica TaxID=2487346 RepID=A0ABX9XG21_9PSED|nr:ATP-dependent zinc protease [Pseudomonas neustonica]ROZ86818.1 ATP-dependent zinc protease [Pseudomonas sp. SSM44]|tara:strand:- start:219 stop:743 length:525 start_codon:yes stop_codon:yes gene_type:complete
MHYLLKKALIPAVALAAIAGSGLSHADAPNSLGWLEEGVIMPEDVTVKFKLDSGALTSSMHAQHIERFEKDGEDWVRFQVELEDIKTEQTVASTFERPLERNLKVRGAGGSEERPVVKMEVCVGEEVLNQEFSLRDRSNMHYPVLLGRRTLDELGMVDTSRTFTTKPACSASQA